MKLTFTFLLFLSLVSCAYNEDLPEPIKKVEGVEITYTSHIKKIIDDNCISCHSSTGGQTPFLTTYSEVKSQADGGRIKARVIDGPSFMPPAGKLPQSEIDTLQLWLDQGKKQ